MVWDLFNMSGMTYGRRGWQASTFINSNQDNFTHLFSFTNETMATVMRPVYKNGDKTVYSHRHGISLLLTTSAWRSRKLASVRREVFYNSHTIRCAKQDVFTLKM